MKRTERGHIGLGLKRGKKNDRLCKLQSRTLESGFS